MGGGLLQLVAYGAQDVYLTGNPQITFFKAVYRRHTNFAIEAIQQTFNGTPTFGQRVTCTIARNGDLIHRMYVAVDLTNYVDGAESVCKFFGLRLLNYVEVEIGGQRIDKHYSHWMYIWNELTLPISKKTGYYEMVGAVGGVPGASTGVKKNLYIPLEFWFCRNVGLALPLISLQYHEVKININFETAEKCSATSSKLTTTFSASLWVDYIFLDTDERQRFAQLSHEYLIEQLQYSGQEAIQTKDIKPKLTDSHTTKKQIEDAISASPTTSTNGAATNHIDTAKLVLNGNDRFALRDGYYFNIIQPFQHHENVPKNAGINVYSFSLKPEEHQPSGSLNMSRIDTAVLQLSMTKSSSYYASPSAPHASFSLNTYAVNYNVLRIMSGMGGIAYSN